MGKKNKNKGLILSFVSTLVTNVPFDISKKDLSLSEISKQIEKNQKVHSPIVVRHGRSINKTFQAPVNTD